MIIITFDSKNKVKFAISAQNGGNVINWETITLLYYEWKKQNIFIINPIK